MFVEAQKTESEIDEIDLGGLTLLIGYRAEFELGALNRGYWAGIVIAGPAASDAVGSMSNNAGVIAIGRKPACVALPYLDEYWSREPRIRHRSARALGSSLRRGGDTGPKCYRGSAEHVVRSAHRGEPPCTAVLRIASLVLGLTVTVGTAQESQHRSTPFSEAAITAQNRADADGYLRVRVQPIGGQTVEATVDVLRRMGENVRIRKEDSGAADFTIEIAFNTPGLQILLSN